MVIEREKTLTEKLLMLEVGEEALIAEEHYRAQTIRAVVNRLNKKCGYKAFAVSTAGLSAQTKVKRIIFQR